MIQYYEDNRTAFIRLNRPEKRNALNPDLVNELIEAFEKAISASTVRVIQLEGEGKVFCAGADLAAIQSMRSYSEQENRADTQRLARLFDIVYRSPKPVIAAVRGAALAGGCGLATVCDICIAEETAKFGYTESRLGFVPALVSVYLARRTGEAHMRRLLLAAEVIDAKEAAAIGLITEAVSNDVFDSRLTYWRDALTGRVSGEAVAATKKLIEKAYILTYDDAIANAVEANINARNSTDCRSGIDRFLEGQPLVW
jgi:methylglutaconyl-CoA hydratase